MIRKSWSGFAPVETTLELWASSLRDVKMRIRPLFAQERTAVNAGLFLDGLLGGEPRKTGWMRAEKRAAYYLAAVKLASVRIWLRHYESLT